MPAVLNRVSHKGIAGILKGKLSRLKPYLRWFIVGLTLFFFAGNPPEPLARGSPNSSGSSGVALGGGKYFSNDVIPYMVGIGVGTDSHAVPGAPWLWGGDRLISANEYGEVSAGKYLAFLRADDPDCGRGESLGGGEFSSAIGTAFVGGSGGDRHGLGVGA